MNEKRGGKGIQEERCPRQRQPPLPRSQGIKRGSCEISSGGGDGEREDRSSQIERVTDARGSTLPPPLVASALSAPIAALHAHIDSGGDGGVSAPPCPTVVARFRGGIHRYTPLRPPPALHSSPPLSLSGLSSGKIRSHPTGGGRAAMASVAPRVDVRGVAGISSNSAITSALFATRGPPVSLPNPRRPIPPTGSAPQSRGPLIPVWPPRPPIHRANLSFITGDGGGVGNPSNPRPVAPVPNRNPTDHRIRVPHRNDILCGRGGNVNSHPGNRAFRQWVLQRKESYNLAETKADKTRVASEVMNRVRDSRPPGRFLQKVRLPEKGHMSQKQQYAGGKKASGYGGGAAPLLQANENSQPWWVEIDEVKAMAKTSQALREGAPAFRLSHGGKIGQGGGRGREQHKDPPQRQAQQGGRDSHVIFVGGALHDQKKYAADVAPQPLSAKYGGESIRRTLESVTTKEVVVDTAVATDVGEKGEATATEPAKSTAPGRGRELPPTKLAMQQLQTAPPPCLQLQPQPQYAPLLHASHSVAATEEKYGAGSPLDMYLPLSDHNSKDNNSNSNLRVLVPIGDFHASIAEVASAIPPTPPGQRRLTEAAAVTVSSSAANVGVGLERKAAMGHDGGDRSRSGTAAATVVGKITAGNNNSITPSLMPTTPPAPPHESVTGLPPGWDLCFSPLSHSNRQYRNYAFGDHSKQSKINALPFASPVSFSHSPFVDNSRTLSLSINWNDDIMEGLEGTEKGFGDTLLYENDGDDRNCKSTYGPAQPSRQLLLSQQETPNMKNIVAQPRRLATPNDLDRTNSHSLLVSAPSSRVAATAAVAPSLPFNFLPNSLPDLLTSGPSSGILPKIDGGAGNMKRSQSWEGADLSQRHSTSSTHRAPRDGGDGCEGNDGYASIDRTSKISPPSPNNTKDKPQGGMLAVPTEDNDGTATRNPSSDHPRQNRRSVSFDIEYSARADR